MISMAPALKLKIESTGLSLKKRGINIYRGVVTGCNEAFIISSERRDSILSNCLSREEQERTADIIKPILRGRDIKRYSYKWDSLWIIYIPWHFPLHLDSSIQGASEKAEALFGGAKEKAGALFGAAKDKAPDALDGAKDAADAAKEAAKGLFKKLF